MTAIVVPQRQYKAVENAVLVSVHAPPTVPCIGIMKIGDTCVVQPEKSERLTKFDCEIFK